jgi:hypothetical protein
MTTEATLNIEQIIKEIRKIIEGNGSVSQKTKDDLLWTAVMAILEAVTPLPEISNRVENLERKNIIMLAEKHPKTAIAMAAAFVLFVAWVTVNPTLQEALSQALHQGLP